ncbi:MAG: hypothetical protein R2710_18335 [Acidimicrobiales bacterium]
MCLQQKSGGGLVGNAVWQGIPLTELLDEAGVLPGATQIQVDLGRRLGLRLPDWPPPTNGRTSLLAVGMNDEREGASWLSARLVVSGLYVPYIGDQVDRIDRTHHPRGLRRFTGSLGLVKLGPIKTQSRIDTPRRNQTVPGATPIAGVAWAPTLGSKVEIRIDGGDWLEASLGESLGPDAWRQ